MAEKIIVAVHGIGEQVRSETIQAVAYQLSKYCGVPGGMALGRFTAELVQASAEAPARFTAELVEAPGGPPTRFTAAVVQAAAPLAPGAFLVHHPPDPALPSDIGFGEVYWANIPRGPAGQRYTLEESKKWARTVVERVRALDRALPGGLSLREHDYELATQVIEEMIETTQVLNHLLFLAEKAGLCRFDLKQLLVDYLGDVQVVADFKNYRQQIVGQFQNVMGWIHDNYPGAEIYLVAHSEGTVIAFLGILEAFCGQSPSQPVSADPASPNRPAWVEQVRGLMTIGSPINKHLLLWPELWDGLARCGPRPEKPIAWRNYYDDGDPIGYRLDRTRDWLQVNGWDGFFEFDAERHDFGFTRYFFAGKAHTDYWQDEGVFGHFFQEVVKPLPTCWQPPPKEYDRPRSKLWPQLISPTLPYVLAAALLFVGVYLLYKAVGECLGIDEAFLDVVRNVFGIGSLLVGITVVVRIPRLTWNWGWRFTGVAVLLGAVWLFPLIVTRFFQDRLGSLFLLFDHSPAVERYLQFAGNAFRWVGLPDVPGTTGGILGFAGVAIVLVCLVSWLRPSWGTKPLLFLGGALIFGIVGFRVSEDTYAREASIKTALAEQTGLSRSPSKLNEATYKVLVRLAENAPKPGEFDARASKEATAVIRQEEYRSRALLPPPGKAAGDQPEIPKVNVHPEVEGSSHGPIWPVVLGGLAFLYLWWLAALFFDLIVVWQHYIRRGAILDRLKEINTRVKVNPHQPPRPAAG